KCIIAITGLEQPNSSSRTETRVVELSDMPIPFRSLLHCRLPVLYTLFEIAQHHVVVSFKRMDRFQEQVDGRSSRPTIDSGKDLFRANNTLPVVRPRKGPVVITAAIRLLQVNDRRVRPGLRE